MLLGGPAVLLGTWGLSGGVKRRREGKGMSTISDPLFLQKLAMQSPSVTVMQVQWQVTQDYGKYRS